MGKRGEGGGRDKGVGGKGREKGWGKRVRGQKGYDKKRVRGQKEGKKGDASTSIGSSFVLL